MRKRLFLFLSALAVAVLLFTFTASADGLASDLVDGESPIFTFLGYSTSDEGGICAGYNVDVGKLEEYEVATNKTLKYGLVVAVKGSYDGNKPLDSTGNIPESNKGNVISMQFEERYQRLSVSISNLNETQLDTHLILSLYVVDPELGVIYIGDEATEVGPQSISYNDVRLGLPSTPAVPPLTEVTINRMTYSINGTTEPAWDRIKQQNNSNADYNTGSSLSSSQLGTFGVKGKAQLIALGGSLINMPAASSLMSHYLKNTGATYTIDVAGFLSDDSGALNSRNNAINNALRASELLAQKGKTVTINQLTEGHPMQGSLATQNWQYAIGSYFDDVDIINLTVTEIDGVKTYTADIKYIVTDYYNWDTNDYNEFKGIVSPHDLHELHKAGIAKEFMSYGEITYSSITWTEGQTVDQIVGLN